MQAPGLQYKARNVQYEATAGKSSISLDISQAYPKKSGISCWKRNIVLHRDASAKAMITITDDVDLKEETSNLYFSFMSLYEPKIDTGKILYNLPGNKGERVSLAFDSEALVPSIEAIDITDESLLNIWGHRLYRLKMDISGPIKEKQFEFIIS